jgi:hypothetical protein
LSSEGGKRRALVTVSREIRYRPVTHSGSLGSENRGERSAKLIGVAEIAEMLGRQGIDKLIRAHGDFPARRLVLIAGRICERVVVERWAREHGRMK